MGIKLTWVDKNVNEEGQRIYRSTSPMDADNLPEPYADLAADVTEFIDRHVDESADYYYYRVSAYIGTDLERVSDELEVRLKEAQLSDNVIYFAVRNANEATYETAMIALLNDIGFTVIKVPEGSLTNTVNLDTEEKQNLSTVLVGAPGDGFTEHPESAAIQNFNCQVVSMCRYTTRNTLGAGSSSGGESSWRESEFIGDGTQPINSDNRYAPGNIIPFYTKSAAGQGVTLNSADWKGIFRSTIGNFKDSVSSDLTGQQPRYHFGYYRTDLATQEYQEVLKRILTRSER